jgi:tight adherence protein B
LRLLTALFAATAVAALVAGATGVRLPFPRPPRRPVTPAWVLAARREGVSPRRVAAASLAAGFTAGLLVVAFTGSVLLAALPAVLVGLVPAWDLRRRAERRRRERVAAWPDTLRSLVSSLQAGQSLHQALLDLARSGPVPLREVWVRYGRLCDHGLPEVLALDTVRHELADPLSDRVCEVLIVATTKGSRIALRVLRDIADATAADVQLAERLETAGVEQRLNARVAFALPWLTLIVLSGRPGPFRDYYASAPGARVLLVALAMSTAGLLLVRRLARLPGEPRVLFDRRRAQR